MPIERACSCRLIFNKKRVLIEGGMHVDNFPIEKGCSEKGVHAGILSFYKVIQFSTCSDHDRFVKFNRRGVLISNEEGEKIILKLIDGGVYLRNQSNFSLSLGILKFF